MAPPLKRRPLRAVRRRWKLAAILATLLMIVIVLMLLSGSEMYGTRSWTKTVEMTKQIKNKGGENATTTESIFSSLNLGVQYEQSLKALYMYSGHLSANANAPSPCNAKLSLPTALAIDEEYCRLDQTKAEKIQFDWVTNLRVDDDFPLRFSLAVARRESSAGRDIKRRGGVKKSATQRLVQRLGPEAVVLDICSDHGWFAFAAASAGARVIAVESDAMSLAALQQSACANPSLINDGKLTLVRLPEPDSGMEQSLKQALPKDAVKDIQGCIAAAVIQCGDRAIDALRASTQYLWTQMDTNRPGTIIVFLENLAEASSGSSSVAQLRRDAVEYAFHTVGPHPRFFFLFNLYVYYIS